MTMIWSIFVDETRGLRPANLAKAMQGKPSITSYAAMLMIFEIIGLRRVCL